MYGLALTEMLSSYYYVARTKAKRRFLFTRHVDERASKWVERGQQRESLPVHLTQSARASLPFTSRITHSDFEFSASVLTIPRGFQFHSVRRPVFVSPGLPSVFSAMRGAQHVTLTPTSSYIDAFARFGTRATGDILSSMHPKYSFLPFYF